MMERSDTRVDWEREIAIATSILLLVSLVVGLLLAIGGVFDVVLFFVVAIPSAIAAWLFFRSRRTTASDRRMGSLAMGIAAIALIGVSALNITSTAEHLQTNRDPGVYLTTGKWLATNGTLLVDGASGGFAGIEGVSGWTGGYYDLRDDGLLYSQFNHGFPVALAVSSWIGGDRLMLNLNPLLGAAFLFFLLILLRRFFVDWVALVAAGTAAFNLVFWHFTRDTYSEPLVALLLVLALLAIDDSVRLGGAHRWMLAGLLIGVTALVRIDAWFYIAIFSGILAIHSWLGNGSASVRFRSRDALAALGAAWAMGAIGFADLVLRSPGYLADLWPNVRLLLAAAFVGGSAALTAVLLVALGPRLVARAKSVWRASESIARRIGGVAVLVFVAWALLWRPSHQLARGHQAGLVTGLMAEEGVPPDATRSFFELSARWLTWYWGPLGILVAAAGWSLVIGLGHLKDRRRLYVPLALTGLALVPYIIDPSITPDQVWALRRFYPMGLIGIAFAAAVPLGLLARWVHRSAHRRWGEPVLVGTAAIVLVVIPGLFAVPLATASTQVGMYGSTMQLCAHLPDDAAVLVEAGRLATVFPAAIRSFCGVPVASLKPEAGRADIEAVAASWEERGRSLYVLGSTNACFVDGDPIASSQFEFTFPERTLTSRPTDTSTELFAWELGRWDGQDAREVRNTAWEIEIRTTWTPPASSSFIATEGDIPGGRWWLEYRQTGMVEFWVTTISGPVGVAYPVRLDDDRTRRILFGFDDEMIYIGCGGNRRTAPAEGIVTKSGSILLGRAHSGDFGNSRFIGEAKVRTVGSG